jgi:DNA-binding beta-propeller fold protein YncE
MRFALAVSLLLPLAAFEASEATGPRPHAPVALATDAENRLVYVAEAANKNIAVVETESHRVVQQIRLPDTPGGLVLDGATLFVTAASPRGSVLVIDAASGSVKHRMAAGHMPRAPVLSPDGETLYLLNRFENAARIIDLTARESSATVPLPREPIDMAITPDGAMLVVLNHLPTGPATAETVAAEVSLIDTRSRSVTASIRLPNGSTSGRQICLTPDGRYAFCTHILARFHNPTTQLVRGWVNTNAFSIIDVRRRTLYATVLLDDVDHGAANPWAVACSADGRTLAVTHAGTHEVSLVDLPALLERLAGLDDQARAAIGEQLSFLVGVRKRIALKGNGPRAAVFAGSDLYVAEYFSDSLSVVGPAGTVRSIAIGGDAPADQVRRGEMLFHDARLCFQSWQSCSSCHPDGRADALNWDLLNDGYGNPKNTKSLLLAHETPPAMILGVRGSAEEAVRAGLRHIHFAVRPEAEAMAIDAYLKSMQPVPSPFLVDGKLGPAALRGREVFAKAKCDECHTGPYFTNLEQYYLGLDRGPDMVRPVDTPTLIEGWRTAPYLLDGRAPDMRSLLVEHNVQDKHGYTSALSEAELEDLLAYLLSL